MASNPSRRLQALLDALTVPMRRAVLKALDRLASRVSLAALERAIATGDTVALTRLSSVLPADLGAAVSLLREAFVTGAKAAAAHVSITFAATDPLSAAAARRASATLVTGISQQTRRAIRSAIADAFTAGTSSREVAKIIKPLIGLTERQAKAVLARRTANLARGMTAAKVTADADRYAAKFLRLRAEMIARTELARASTEGQIAAWQQAQQSGQLDPALRKVWIVTPDDRLCPLCAPLDGVTAPIDGVFRAGRVVVIGPPLHTDCRCAIGLKQARQVRRTAA